MDAQRIIEHLGLEPLGFEGGYYREAHRSTLELGASALPDHGGGRSAATAIYYLLTPNSLSLMHRLRTDEVYHFYLGDPVEQLMLHPDGRSETVTLGSDVLAEQRVQHVVPAGVWQGSRLVPGGRFALMGTTMAPGFDLADFELGDRAALLAEHPDRAELLEALTPLRLMTARYELAAATLDLLVADLRGRDHLAAGLRAQVPALRGRRGPSEAELAAAKAELESDPTRRGRGWWYVIDRGSRALVGHARLADGSVHVAVEGEPEEIAGALLGHASAGGPELGQSPSA